MMSAYIIKNRLTQPSELLLFDVDGYVYNKALSADASPVFTRKQ